MQLTFSVTRDGLALGVLVGVDRADSLTLIHSNLPVPPPIRCTAVVDTGSSVTCVSARILQQLAPRKKSASSTQTASGPMNVNLFSVSLGIPLVVPTPTSHVLDPQLTVMELALPIPGIDVLIGLDVLLNGKLFLDGPARQFTLEVRSRFRPAGFAWLSRLPCWRIPSYSRHGMISRTGEDRTWAESPSGFTSAKPAHSCSLPSCRFILSAAPFVPQPNRCAMPT